MKLISHLLVIILYPLLTGGLMFANTLQSDTKISILTIAPGAHLNDAFGHSAIRVKTNTIDAVFNYGVYDFNAPNFYANFAKGKLYYRLDVSDFNNFTAYYISQQRAVTEQDLNLSQTEAEAIVSFLTENAKPENQTYVYDFFYNNCATKLLDVISEATQKSVTLNNSGSVSDLTFRQLIHSKLPANTWGSFGIYLALGSIIDKPTTTKEQLFLPEFVYRNFKTASLEGENLIRSENTIYTPSTPSSYTSGFLSSPFLILLVLSILIVIKTYYDNIQQKQSKWMDVLLLVITGLIGSVLFWLWFGTNHTATAFNYNMLWAFPLNIILAFLIAKAKVPGWITRYYKFLIIMLILMLFHWIVGVQRFSPVLVPLLIALLLRYVFIVYYHTQHKQLIN